MNGLLINVNVKNEKDGQTQRNFYVGASAHYKSNWVGLTYL